MSGQVAMQALEVRAISDSLEGCVLVQRPQPRPAPGEVLVRVRAAALGFPALLIISGAYQHKPELPFVLGGDLAGEVVALGEGVDLPLGARVAGGALTGALAAYCALPAGDLLAIPDGVSFAEAAAFPSAYLTAHVSLVHVARLVRDEWVLVLGGAGGVGLAAVDLALALGARVIAAASTPAKRAAIAAAHPQAHVIDSAKPFKQEVRALSGGGVQVAFDPVGGAAFNQALSCLTFAGRLLVVGFASGQIPDLAVNRALIKNLAVLGVRAGEYGRQRPEHRAESMAALTALWGQGVLRPRVDSELPLELWRDGMARLTARACVGRVILTPGG